MMSQNNCLPTPKCLKDDGHLMRRHVQQTSAESIPYDLQTSTQTTQRLQADRTRHSGNREAETSAQTSQRLEAQVARQRDNREAETSAQTTQRLQADRTRHSDNREAETSTQRTLRQAADVARQRIRRQSEMYTHRTPGQPPRIRPDANDFAARCLPSRNCVAPCMSDLWQLLAHTVGHCASHGKH